MYLLRCDHATHAHQARDCWWLGKSRLCRVAALNRGGAISVSVITRGQSNLTKSASRGDHSPVRGHPRGSKFVSLNSWGRGSY